MVIMIGFLGFQKKHPSPSLEGSSSRKNWVFSRSNVPSPDGSGNPLARVAILGRAERATKRSSFAT
jgi:hypothetical protein